jgi:hypothetical protein
MRLPLHLTTIIVATALLNAHSAPTVSFSGYLDSDVWTDFSGTLYSNDELDLGMSLAFSERVSVGVFATVASGSIPAGTGRPGGSSTLSIDDTISIVDEQWSRWVSVQFDGITLTYDSPIGEFAAGDLVYQFGCFNYYFYKRLSMITPERFTRGIQYTIGNDIVSQRLLIGSADMDSYGDIVAATEITPSENHAIGIYYGTRGNVRLDFGAGFEIFAGAEYTAAFGEVLSTKLDIGYRSLPEDSLGTRPSVISILLEPVLTLGDFSTAVSVYSFIDPDESGANLIDDEFFVYCEPGYAFTDLFALGLPLEIHAPRIDSIADSGAFWAVPTGYIYPADGVEW